MIQQNESNQMYRLTTQIKKFFSDTVTSGPDPPATTRDVADNIDLYTTDWSEGVVKQGPQLMRFHLFTTMPGDVNDNISSLNYDDIKAFIYDLRARKEWGKFKLTNAGDGVYS